MGFSSTAPGLSALLLTLVVTIFGLRPLVGLSVAGRVLIEVCFVLVLLAGVWTVWRHRRQAILLTAVIVIVELVRWLHRQMPAAGSAPWEALSGPSPWGSSCSSSSTGSSGHPHRPTGLHGDCLEGGRRAEPERDLAAVKGRCCLYRRPIFDIFFVGVPAVATSFQ